MISFWPKRKKPLDEVKNYLELMLPKAGDQILISYSQNEIEGTYNTWQIQVANRQLNLAIASSQHLYIELINNGKIQNIFNFYQETELLKDYVIAFFTTCHSIQIESMKPLFKNLQLPTENFIAPAQIKARDWAKLTQDFVVKAINDVKHDPDKLINSTLLFRSGERTSLQILIFSLDFQWHFERDASFWMVVYDHRQGDKPELKLRQNFDYLAPPVFDLAINLIDQITLASLKK